MTDKWSKNLPTKPGWYWWRAKTDYEPIVLNVVKFQNSIRIWNGKWRTPEWLAGEWWPERIEIPHD